MYLYNLKHKLQEGHIFEIDIFDITEITLIFIGIVLNKSNNNFYVEFTNVLL